MNPNSFLSTAQLADLYRIDGKAVPKQWYDEIVRWRDRGLLRYPDYIHPAGNTRTYQLGRIAAIVSTSHDLFSERVMYCNRDAILKIARG